MTDQITTPTHKYIDRVEERLQRQRDEDQRELTRAMDGINQMLRGLGKKMDKILVTQGDHGEKIAAMCAKDEARQEAKAETGRNQAVMAGGAKWPNVPPWLRVLIYIIGSVLAGGGSVYALKTAPAPQTQAAPATTQEAQP